MKTSKNILGEELKLCSLNPKTGYFRDGTCNTDSSDFGEHCICAEMTDEFLEYTKEKGNDLSTPKPEWGFPGLKAGDRWCLCTSRWLEAYEAGKAPKVVLEATHESVLQKAEFEIFKKNQA